MNTRFPAAIAAMLLACTGAQAADAFVYGGVGTHSSVGAGLQITPQTDLRIGLGEGRIGPPDHDIDGAHYSFHPRGSAALDLFADWHPLAGSGLRLTGGLSIDRRTRIDFSSAQGNGQARIGRVLPTLGVGWDWTPAAQSPWRITTDLKLQAEHISHVSLSGAPAPQHVADDIGGTHWRLGLGVGLAYAF